MRSRIANSGMDFWAMLAAAALATLLLVAATQLQAQTYPVQHNFSRPESVMSSPNASMHDGGTAFAAPAQRGCTGKACYGGCGSLLEKARKGSASVFLTSAVGSETTGDGISLEAISD
jgi:hypothetical protein